MPTASYLVNTARGGLVDPDAGQQSLEDGRLAGVALDVLPEEPPPSDHPLLTHPRVLVTPHVAWYSEESEVELRREAAENVVAWRRPGDLPTTSLTVTDAATLELERPGSGVASGGALPRRVSSDAAPMTGLR
jgi:phosphoglycerate dehydrogenase-like enzyme